MEHIQITRTLPVFFGRADNGNFVAYSEQSPFFCFEGADWQTVATKVAGAMEAHDGVSSPRRVSDRTQG